MNKIGIFYGSTTGNTESVAEKLQVQFGSADCINVGNTPLSEMSKYETVILGSSTWGLGELQDDWVPLAGELSQIDLTGRNVAFFGTGDQSSYPDTFADALGILYESVQKNNTRIIGAWPTDGYDFTASRAVVDGAFIGLVIDEDTQGAMTDERIRQWAEQIKKEL